MMLDTLLH